MRKHICSWGSLRLLLPLLIIACDNQTPDKQLYEHSAVLDQALQNGQLANKGLRRCRNYMNAWLRRTDPVTGLIPRNVINQGHHIWNAKDAAADNYPFMVLTAALLDRHLFETRMKEILLAEQRLTSRVGRLPDDYSFLTK